MTAKLNWDKINIDNSKGKSSKKDDNKKKKQYVILGKKAKGNVYILRPVGSPIGVYKAVLKLPGNQYRNVNVAMDENGSDTHVRNHPLHLHHNVDFQAKYVINVIDREDNQLKILEGGISIFEAFRNYHEMTEKNPGGKNGADFRLEVTGQKGKDYYKVNKHQSTTLTDEEVKFLSDEGLYDLEEIYQETPEKLWKAWIDQVEKEEGSEGSSYNSESNASYNTQKSQSETKEEDPVASSSTNDNDLDALNDEIDADELPFT